MAGIAVLSPHRDDAVFSLAGWMHQWAKRGNCVHIFNFYTVSDYAPWIPLTEGATKRTVTVNRRAHEDRAAIRKVHTGICTRSFRLMDAPLRLGKEVGHVMQVSSKEIRREDVQEITRKLKHVRRSWLVIAPLGLGGHIDHLTVRQAALEAFPRARLGFYEDLPYATWTSWKALKQELSQVTSDGLRKCALVDPPARFVKQSWVSMYRSQIGRQDAQLIARRANEQIWVPGRGPWTKVLNCLP